MALCPKIVSTLITSYREPVGSTEVREVGTKVTFSCLSGYTLQGSQAVVCLSNGQWDNDKPACVGAGSSQTTDQNAGSGQRTDQTVYVIILTTTAMLLFILLVTVTVVYHRWKARLERLGDLEQARSRYPESRYAEPYTYAPYRTPRTRDHRRHLKRSLSHGADVEFVGFIGHSVHRLPLYLRSDLVRGRSMSSVEELVHYSLSRRWLRSFDFNTTER